MKKQISVLLAILLAFAVLVVPASAAEGFDKSVFESSRKFQKNGEFWSLAGNYVDRSTGCMINVSAYLSSTYVSEGWGPELRVQLKNISQNRYDTVTAFIAKVNGIEYAFENLAYNDHTAIQGGYLFGGNVYYQMIKELANVRSASFQVVHTDAEGKSVTTSIDHVHTGELSDLQSVAKYLISSNAFFTDKNPDENDLRYGAVIR